MDGFEEGPETWEAGAYDAESEFGVRPDACACVPFFLTVTVSLSYTKGTGIG